MTTQTEQGVRLFGFVFDFFTYKTYALAASESLAKTQFSQALDLIPINSMPM